MNTTLHFSCKSDNWATPQALFDRLAAQHGPFDLDVCASPSNAKCTRFLSAEQDALSHDWFATCAWMNPPYGYGIKHWVKKAADEVASGRCKKLVALLPSKTGTSWWHDYVMPHAQITFLRGRVKFAGHPHNAPFDSAVAVYLSGGAS